MIAHPIDPGIHDKNSKSPKLLSLAKLATFRSRVAAPVSKVSFSTPRVLDNGAKLVYVNYNSGKFCVQTPWMTMPWKMGVYTEDKYPKLHTAWVNQTTKDLPKIYSGFDKDSPSIKVLHPLYYFYLP